MQIKSILFSVVFVLIASGLMAQNGNVRGKVTSGENGEALVGAVIKLVKGDKPVGGAYADLDGQFSIQPKPQAGTYWVEISYLSYISDTIQNVEVKAGEVTVLESILYENLQEMSDEVVIVGQRNKASTVSLFHLKRTASNSIDGISTDAIARTGDNNVAAALQRVSGVTIEDGKYVLVRGLGDRYSSAMLNGAVLPNLDPNRNSVQLDVIPSGLIDNLVVYKTFTPNLPGSFTGGLVDVVTKDFPDKLKVNFSASLGFNPQATLNSDFLSYETGKTDWLGFDDGTRALPDVIQTNGVPNRITPSDITPTEVAQLESIQQTSRSFDTQMFPTKKTSFLNQNYSFSIGNMHEVGKGKFGYIAGLSYRNSYNAYEDGRISRWRNTNDASQGVLATSLNNERDHNVTNGAQNVLWGSLVKLSYKLDKHSFSVNYIHNQSGSSETTSMEGPIPTDAPDLIFQTRTLSYIERAMDAIQLEGKHSFGPLKMDWIGSYTLSSEETPDLRFFSNDYTPDGETRNYDLQENLYAPPSRFYRDLSENNLDLRLNFELPFKQWSDLETKVKFGGAYTTKDRTFVENRYQILQGSISNSYQGDPEAFFSDANTGYVIDTIVFGGQLIPQVKYNNFLTDASEARNAYNGEQAIQAAYAMIELPVTERLKFIGGARYEGTQATTTSMDSSLQKGELDLHDILPVASVVYTLSEKMNLRGGYTRTLARPTFREFSPFVSYGFAGDFDTKGNPDLQRTLIDNMDVRWELYPSPNELISASVFYKNFTNPIEKTFVREAKNELTWTNVPQATLYGLEIEVRKNLKFISEKLQNFQVGGNLSLLQSEVDIDPEFYKDITAIDPDRPATRSLQGQSPYSVNAELAYIGIENGLKASLSYAVFGERISVVGAVSSPDVYEQPRGLMNFSVSKSFGKVSLRFRANNLLNPEYKQTQTFLDNEYVFQNYQLGRSFSLGASLSL